MPVVEIEVENAHNANLFFLPLGKLLRGRLDFLLVSEKEAMPQAREFPKGVPGQRLRLDTEAKTAAILEPLREPAHAATRERIEKKGMTIGPASEEVGNVDVPTWAYWLKRAVEGGLARVVRGSLPPIEGKPRKQFMTAERPDQAEEDRLLKRQEVAAKLAMMSPAQRKEYDRIMAE